jgi:uncharacterized protein YdaU (DUF1376 family)
MAKQPYIPLYTGDYLKDTRMLPLEARGAWVDLMVFMWESKSRGILVYTMPEYAMLMSCTLQQADFAIGLLQQKGICDFEIMQNGLVKLICRRMVRDCQLSKTRSEAGKTGVAAKFAKANATAKTQANTDSDIDNDNEVEIGFKEKESEEKPSSVVAAVEVLQPTTFATPPDKLSGVYDEITRENLLMAYRDVDVDDQWKKFEVKVRGAPRHYADHTTEGLRMAFQSHLKTAPKKQVKINQQITTEKKEKFKNL